MEISKEIVDKMLELNLLEKKLEYNEYMLYTNRQSMIAGIVYKSTIISITLLLTYMTFAYNMNTSLWFLILPLYVAYWSINRDIYNYHDNKKEREELIATEKKIKEKIGNLTKEIKLLEDINNVSLENNIYTRIVDNTVKNYDRPINIPKDEFTKIINSSDNKPFTLNLTK